MFEHFTKSKVDEYLAKVNFIYGRTSLSTIQNSGLPAYIQSYLENSLNNSHLAIEKEQLGELLFKAINLNISYVIKPKSTLIRFLFGKVETKPSEEIRKKLDYFQFYRYYADLITEFIQLNNPLRISSSQVEKLINEINRKIYEEITDTSSEEHLRQRLNLIKLIYYFFMDYFPDSKPVNKRLPKSILAAFFYDKGFLAIKKNIDGFFKEDIYIQEAIELMTPKEIVSNKETEVSNDDNNQINEIIKKAREAVLSTEATRKDVEQTIEEGEKIIEVKDFSKSETTGTTYKPVIKENAVKQTPEPKTNEELPVLTDDEKQKLTQEEIKPPEKQEIDIDEKIEEAIYSPELSKEAAIDNRPQTLSPLGSDNKLIYELFSNERHRTKIIRRLFDKNVKFFEEKVSMILDAHDWGEATFIIDDHFEKNKINFLSAEAIRFIDTLQVYFQEFKAPVNTDEEDKEE